MAKINLPHTLRDGKEAFAAKVMANFQSILDWANAGAGSIDVDIEGMEAKEVEAALAELLAAIIDRYTKTEADANLAAHTSRIDNPHAVSATQAAFSGAASGIDATNTQTAIDKLVAELFTLLNRQKGALASLKGIDNAGGNIELLGENGINVIVNKDAKSITLAGTGTGPGGKDGKLMMAFYINEEGHLIVTTDDAIADKLHIDETGHLVYEVDDVGVDLGSVRGEQGPVGPEGPEGPQGPPGQSSSGEPGDIIMWYGAVEELETIKPGWWFCDGTRGTPDMRDRVPVGTGNLYQLDDSGGANSVTLTVAQLASHNHNISVFDTSTSGLKVEGATSATSQGVVVTGSTGSNQAHENRMPYRALHFIMKLYPEEV